MQNTMFSCSTGAVHRIRTCKAFRLNCFQGSSLTTRTDSIYKVETVGFEPTPDKSDKITLTSLHSLWEKFPYMWHLPLYLFTLGGIVRIFSNGLYSFPSTKMKFLNRLLKISINLNMRPYSIALNRLFTHLLVLLQCRPFGLARKPRLELRTQQSKCCVIPFHHFRILFYKF